MILSLAQWLILRQTEMTPRVFALINTRPLADILKRSPIFKLVVIGCSFLTYWDKLAYHLQRVALQDWAMPHRKLGECEPIVRVPATLL